MKGITSGLRPTRLKDGGFPDLTGDGKVTRADILKGRGVEGFAEGGDADSRFINMQRTAEGSGANLRDFTDFIFDPTDPVDYALLPLLAFPPAAIAARLIRMGVKGSKLAKSMKKVETIKDAQRGAGAKAKDLFTTDPVKNMAAANGLLLGPTRSTATSIAGQMTARNELADLTTTNDRNISRIGGIQLYSQDAKDQIKADPSMVKKGGLNDLVELKELGSEFYDILKDPDGREAIAETIKESISIPKGIANLVGTVDSEIVNKRDGGIMYAKAGGAVTLSKKFLNLVKKNKALQNKDGSPKKSTKPYKDEIANQNAAKKQATADKSKATREANKQKAVRDEAERLARSKRASDARANTGQSAQQRLNSRSAQADVGPPRPIAGADGPIKGQGPAISSKVDDANLNSNAAKKLDDPEIINPGGDNIVPPTGNIFTNNMITRNPVKTVVAAAAANEILMPFGAENTFFRQPTDDATVTGSDKDSDQVTIYDDDIFNNDPQAKIPDRDPTAWADIMKARIVNDRGIPLDDKGNFTEKPKFMDYLKSLPGAYADKVSRDEDFAKKMIAGFLNMMRPVEGFVPVNSAVAFGDAYFNEETRQADMLPADAKMLEYLKGDDEAFERYLRAEQAKSGILLADTKPELARGYYDMLISSLGQTQMPGVNVLDKLNKGEIRLVYKGAPVGTIEILALMDQNVDVLRDPGFKLEEI